MKVFVTGATGFVGSAVVHSLVHHGADVRVLARPSSDLRNVGGLSVDIAYGDLLDGDGLEKMLSGCDTLYHVAAFYSTAEADSRKIYEINVRGTKNIFRAALNAGVRRAVHTSTIGTIGQPRGGSLATEDVPFSQWESASHYARSKYLGEVAALHMCAAGLSLVVVNPCAPVGPRDIKPSSTGERILDYLQGREPSFLSGGINFVSVRDVAEGHLLAAEKGRAGERYILGHHDGNLQLPTFLELMERASGLRPPSSADHSGSAFMLRRVLNSLRLGAAASSKIGDPANDRQPTALTCDPSKAIRELGLPQTSLDAAFAEAVSWFRENGYVKPREQA